MKAGAPSVARRISGVAAVVSCLLVRVLPASGQTPDDLNAACLIQTGMLQECRVASVAPIVVAGHLGFLSGAGSQVAGTASNLGTRVSSGPRLSFSARTSLLHAGAPDLSDPQGQRERSFLAQAFHVDATAGVFDGFRIMPTVGGFLSLDLTARAGLLFLPVEDHFSENVRSWSLGARVGIFREGFTVPGVSVSVARRFPGAVTYGDFGRGDAAEVLVDVSVTSWRATIGKDLYAIEFLAGVGIDDHSGTTTVRLPGLGFSTTVPGDVEGSRWLWFGSAARTFSIVLTLAVEAGWAGGFDATTAPTGVYDVSNGSPFGAFSLRLTI